MTENIVKTLPLADGFAVETVYYGSGTLCISAQAGCRMACPFCASGRKGLIRNLTAEEMHAQTALHSGFKRVTLSGIGEPMDNITEVVRFISESEESVTLTTAVPDVLLLGELFRSGHNGIMLSLHAGLEGTRKKLVPKGASLADIKESLSLIWSELSRTRRRKTGFNYMLLEGVNDSDEELAAFMDFALCFKDATVHLLFCNDVEKSRYKSPDKEIVDSVYERMASAGLNVRRANRWRKKAKGGCGTLFLRSLQK